MRWRWTKRSVRSQLDTVPTDFTSWIVSGLQASAEGGDALARTSSAAQAAATTWSRTLAASADTGPGSADLAAIGRDLILCGQSVWLVRDHEIVRASCWEIEGRERPWMWRITTETPDGPRTWKAPETRVVNILWAGAGDPLRPWAGIAPVDCWAGRALAWLERRVSEEASMPTTWMTEFPAAASNEAWQALKVALRSHAKREGHIIPMPSSVDAVVGGEPYRPSAGWKPHRIGATPPQALVMLHTELSAAVTTACGLPAQTQGGDAARADMRRTLRWSVEPQVKLIEAAFHGAGVECNLIPARAGLVDADSLSRAAMRLHSMGFGADSACEAVGLPVPEGPVTVQE